MSAKDERQKKSPASISGTFRVQGGRSSLPRRRLLAEENSITATTFPSSLRLARHRPLQQHTGLCHKRATWDYKRQVIDTHTPACVRVVRDRGIFRARLSMLFCFSFFFGACCLFFAIYLGVCRFDNSFHSGDY